MHPEEDALGLRWVWSRPDHPRDEPRRIFSAPLLAACTSRKLDILRYGSLELISTTEVLEKLITLLRRVRASREN
jgi:hypothetical protein